MAVQAINFGRVSNNLRSFNLLQALRVNNLGLFRVQTQIATGLKFAAPSEDPTGAATVGVVNRKLDQLGTVSTNLRNANASLTAADSAMSEAVELLRSARATALEASGDTLSADERTALATVIDSIVEQTVSIGNRRHLDSALFSGRLGNQAAFEITANGVLFRGDMGRAETIVDSDQSRDSFTISGSDFFGALSQAVRGTVDLNPALTPETRLSDIDGANAHGFRPGRIRVSDGSFSADVDLTSADTLGDVLDALNANLQNGWQAELTSNSILITGNGIAAGGITVQDLGGGRAAADLGLLEEGGVAAGGSDLNARVTPRTALSDLRGGLGINLANGLTLRNGTESTTVSFSGAETVEEVLNRLNGSGAGVWARIGDDGQTLEVLNRVSGSELRIEEAGGSAAAALGIRTMSGATTLAALNDGRGVHTVPGYDIQVTTRSGAAIQVDIDGAATLQDVINRLNSAGGGLITASFVTTGNGIQIRDNTAGPNTLAIERVNLSPAIDGLGLNVTTTTNTLTGRDVNPVRVRGTFTALLDLREGLAANDRDAVGAAAERIESALREMEAVHGELASKARVMDERVSRIENETTAAQVLQSDARDVDLAEAMVRFGQFQTALEANMQTAARVMNLSLLDYLR